MSETEAARRGPHPHASRTRHRDPEARAAGPQPPAPILSLPPTIVRTLSLLLQQILGKEDSEAAPLERKETALIVSLNYEQKEYLARRDHFSQKMLNYL